MDRSKNLSKIELVLQHLQLNAKATEIYPENFERRGESQYKINFDVNKTFVTFTHFTKALLGPTILAIPAGFKNGGLAFSCPCFLALILLMGYNIRSLIESAAHLSEREQMQVRTYDEVAYVSFSTCTRWTKTRAAALKHTINLLFFITYLDACIIFMIFVARNVEAVMMYYYPKSFFTVHYYIFFQVILLMSMSSIRQLKHLAPFSFISCALLIIVAVSLVSLYFVKDTASIHERLMIGTPRSIFHFICIVLFCMSGISIALTLKSSMKHPQHFFSGPGIYYLSLVLVSLLFLGFGFMGYLKYGSNTKASILLNVPPESALSIGIKIAAIIAVLLTSPLVFYVAFNVLWNNYLKPHFISINVLFSEYFIRVCLIIICYLMATAFPDLGAMIVLKGALFHSHLEVTIPPIVKYAAYYPEKGTGKFHIRLFSTICICFIGGVFCIGGVTVSVLDWMHLE